MDISDIIGNNLRAYRKKRNITQAKLSELSGVHRTTLGSIERGVISPRSATLQSLADALDIAIMQLFAEFDETGCLIIGKSTQYLREHNLEKQYPRHGRGRRRKNSESSNQPQINYGLISWSDNMLYDLDVPQEEQELAIQTLDNLKKHGCSEEDLTKQFSVVWPKIKAIYGID